MIGEQTAKPSTTPARRSLRLLSILDHPFFYLLSQHIFGRKKGTTAFVKNFVRPRKGDKILDIGCGPAEILDYLPAVDYWGFDVSPAYIEQAKAKYKNTGHFMCKELAAADLESLPKFDIVLLAGVLHHLDDAKADATIRLASQALKPGGRLVTCDPCLEPGQNPLAKLFISWDRGKNVRTREGYSALVSEVFPHPRIEVSHQTLPPYTLCSMECTRP